MTNRVVHTELRWQKAECAGVLSDDGIDSSEPLAESNVRSSVGVRRIGSRFEELAELLLPRSVASGQNPSAARQQDEGR